MGLIIEREPELATSHSTPLQGILQLCTLTLSFGVEHRTLSQIIGILNLSVLLLRVGLLTIM